MTSQLNLENIYTELNNLLKDVCSFLTTEAQNGTLSAKAKNEAEKLVSRSRQQVDVVTKLSEFQESTNSNYPYLEMQGPRGTEEPLSEYVAADTDYYEPEHYAPVDIESPELTSITPVKEELGLYHDLPMCMIEEKSVKYGPLSRKERYLFIEQKKQYMAALVGYWLLIYAVNKKDQKPLQIINLLNYSARSIEQRKDPAFEICAENEKSHEFIARSSKDMEQWVVAINCKKHICTNGRDLPEVPPETRCPEFENADRNSNQINSDDQIVMHYGSEEDIYASVEDFGKTEILKPSTTTTVVDFPVLPPRSKVIPTPPKKSTNDNTYNNLKKTETEVTEDTDSEYDFVQCSDTQKQKNNEEEPLEMYDELKVTETINKNVRKPLFLNDNYDNVDTGEEELEDYDTVKPMPKIPVKNNGSLKSDEEEDEEMVDYDELKPIPLPNNSKHTFLNRNQFQNDEELEDYDELKPIPYNNQMKSDQPIQFIPDNNPEEEPLEDYDVLKPVSQNYKNKPTTSNDEELENYDELKPISQNSKHKSKTPPPEDEELAEYDELKPISNSNQSNSSGPEHSKEEEKLEVYNKSKPNKQTENISKKSVNNDETISMKPAKQVKKFWERRSESPRKETDTDDNDYSISLSKRNVANLKTKLNTQEKNKPPITSPKPKSQMLLNKFPSFSKNRMSKEEDGNSKVQNIRQQLEHTLSFRNHK